MIVGIDPDFQGAIAFLGDDGSLFAAEAMPVYRVKSQKALDYAGLLCVLQKHLDPNEAHRGVLEWVNTRPNQAGGFTFGQTFGACQMALHAVGAKPFLAAPNLWKRAVGLRTGAEKKESRALAERLFNCNMRSQSRSEAALMALALAKGLIGPKPKLG